MCSVMSIFLYKLTAPHNNLTYKENGLMLAFVNPCKTYITITLLLGEVSNYWAIADDC